MSRLEITYGDDWSSMFLAGLPPKDITERQWQALGELASIHTKRAKGWKPANPNGIYFVGGWSITARTSEFAELHNIAAAILTHHYGTLTTYRDKPEGTETQQ